jgi:hypothetical protein
MDDSGADPRVRTGAPARAGRRPVAILVALGALAIVASVIGAAAGVAPSAPAGSTAPAAAQASAAVRSFPPTPPASASPIATPVATVSPTPTPIVRAPVDVDLVVDHDRFFVTQYTKKLCAAAGVQIAVNLLTRRPDTTKARQLAIHDLEVRLTTWADSHNGGTGPEGMAAAVTRLSGVPYELRIYDTRAAALRGAAVAISTQRQPVILMAWRGAHTWVMSGYRADADPALFADAAVSGAYILDPWYPRVSSIWGPSDRPGTYQDAAEMKRNFLPYKRPEGRYPGRDGKFLIVVPVATPN